MERSRGRRGVGIPTVGTVLLVNFPYADLKTYKKRPAVVVAEGSLSTVILCQITSRELARVPGVKLGPVDFLEGGLPLISYVRPDKLFTVDSMSRQTSLGKLRPAKMKIIREQITKLFL